jgi:predicted PurR-regulated permease PerM
LLDQQTDAATANAKISVFQGVATFALIASLLYLGAGILVPLVLAILLAFGLTPLVTSLNRRLHLPDPLAVIVAVVLALAALGIFAYVAGTQIVNLTQELPGCLSPDSFAALRVYRRSPQTAPVFRQSRLENRQAV